jgi:uncharacterized phage protein gp47/JayE
VIETLTTPLTRTQVQESIYSAMAALGVTTTTWKPGAVVRAIVTGVSIVIAAFSQLIALLARSAFLEFSTGDWLTLVALHVYDVTRNPGTFATGSVVLDNTGGGIHSGDPGDLVVRTEDGRTYRNTAAFAVAAFETGVVVPIQAVELGSASTAAPNAITEFETPLIGVTVTNPAAVVGSDPESDPALRSRCRERTGPLSPNGPRDAYSFVARSATRADGSAIGVTRVRPVPDGIGGVDVYLATATGGVTGDAEDPETDLGAIADAIHRLVEPIAVTPRVQSADSEPIPVTYTLWLKDDTGLTSAEIEEAIEDRLVTFMATQPIGGNKLPGESTGRVYVAAIKSLIGCVFESSTLNVDVTAPAADVDLDPNEAPVLGTVTATIHQVPGGDL